MGYFLQGIYRTDDTWLHNIEQASCCRRRNFINKPLDCYDHDVMASLDAQGWSACQNGSYMAGVFRSDCDELHCIEQFRCCRMRPSGIHSSRLGKFGVMTSGSKYIQGIHE